VKAIAKALAAWIAITALLYLAGYFVAVSFHPGVWAPEGRMLVAFFVTAGAVVAVFTALWEGK